MLKRLTTRMASFLRPKKVVERPKLHRPVYIDIHKDRDFLLLATGPTVERYKEDIMGFINRVNPITIGCNNISKLYTPNYHAFINRKRFVENISFIDKEKTRVIISPYIAKWIIRRHFRDEYWPLMFADRPEGDFRISDGILFSSCKTSALMMIGLSIVMGAKKIHIAGLDGYSKYFLDGEKINCLDVKSKYGSFEKDRRHYLRLEQLNERYLKEMDDYFFAKRGNRLKIITPTVHAKYYDKEVLELR